MRLILLHRILADDEARSSVVGFLLFFARGEFPGGVIETIFERAIVDQQACRPCFGVSEC